MNASVDEQKTACNLEHIIVKDQQFFSVPLPKLKKQLEKNDLLSPTKKYSVFLSMEESTLSFRFNYSDSPTFHLDVYLGRSLSQDVFDRDRNVVLHLTNYDWNRGLLSVTPFSDVLKTVESLWEKRHQRLSSKSVWLALTEKTKADQNVNDGDVKNAKETLQTVGRLPYPGEEKGWIEIPIFKPTDKDNGRVVLAGRVFPSVDRNSNLYSVFLEPMANHFLAEGDTRPVPKLKLYTPKKISGQPMETNLYVDWDYCRLLTRQEMALRYEMIFNNHRQTFGFDTHHARQRAFNALSELEQILRPLPDDALIHVLKAYRTMGVPSTFVSKDLETGTRRLHVYGATPSKSFIVATEDHSEAAVRAFVGRTTLMGKWTKIDVSKNIEQLRRQTKNVEPLER